MSAMVLFCAERLRATRKLGTATEPKAATTPRSNARHRYFMLVGTRSAADRFHNFASALAYTLTMARFVLGTVSLLMAALLFLTAVGMGIATTSLRLPAGLLVMCVAAGIF